MKQIVSWDDLLASKEDTEFAEVPVGGEKVVRLGTLSAADMLTWLAANSDDEAKKINGLRLVAMSMVDSDGARIGVLADVVRLREKNPKTIKKLVDAAVKLNGLSVAPDTSAKVTVLEEAKNDSGETHTDASPSDSPSA